MDSSRWPSLPRLAVPVLAMVVAMTVTVAVDGCTRSHPPRSATTLPSAATATATLRTQARSVIAQDVATQRWSRLVGYAETLLVAQCMKRHGYTYAVPAPDPEPSPATITVDALGARGPATYGVLPHHAQPTNTDADQPSFQRTLDGAPTEIAAMTMPDGSTIGYETGGCLGEARTRLFGSVRAYVASAYLPEAVRDEFDASLTVDGPYTTARNAWHSCMALGGWSFDAPAAAIASLETAQQDAASLNHRQAAIASADRDCDSQSHLRAERSQALTRFIAALPDRVLAELDEIHTSRERAEQAARRALSP